MSKSDELFIGRYSCVNANYPLQNGRCLIFRVAEQRSEFFLTKVVWYGIILKIPDMIIL